MPTEPEGGRGGPPLRVKQKCKRKGAKKKKEKIASTIGTNPIVTRAIRPEWRRGGVIFTIALEDLFIGYRNIPLPARTHAHTHSLEARLSIKEGGKVAKRLE